MCIRDRSFEKVTGSFVCAPAETGIATRIAAARSRTNALMPYSTAECLTVLPGGEVPYWIDVVNVNDEESQEP